MAQLANAYTYAAAAQSLGISRQRVHQLVHSGRLSTMTLHGRRYVTDASIAAYSLERARGRKRP